MPIPDRSNWPPAWFDRNTSPNLGGGLNEAGLISYNGFTFRGPRVRAEFTVVPIEDEAGRTTVANEYTVTVRAVVTDDLDTGYGQTGNAQDSVDRIRGKLTKMGGHLIIQGFGLPIEINNGNGNPYAQNWGPRTRSISFFPFGNGLTFQVDWVFVFRVAECYSEGDVAIRYPGLIGAGDLADKLVDLNFRVAYSINNEGLTSRTIEGHFTILNQRSRVVNGGSNNAIAVTVDQFRTIIAPEVPLGFERERQEWQLNAAKDRMEFQIIDREKNSQYAPPPGVIDIQMSHSSTMAGKAVNFTQPYIDCSIRGGFLVSLESNYGRAWDSVLLLIQGRLDKARAQLPADKRDKNILIQGISIDESMIGPRQVSFQVDYKIILPNASQNNLITATGMFTPPTRSDNNNVYSWGDWKSSMQTEWSQRGYAELEFQPEQDSIVSLCDNTTPTDLSDTFTIVPTSLGGGTLVNDCSKILGKYMRWDVNLMITAGDTGMVHTEMRPEDSPPSASSETTSDGRPMGLQVDDSDSYTKFQNVGVTRTSVVIVGRAERFGKPPEKMTIEEEDLLEMAYNPVGVSITNIQQLYGSSEKRFEGGCLVLSSDWSYSFEITGPQADVRTALNNIEIKLRFTPEDDTGEDKLNQ